MNIRLKLQPKQGLLDYLYEHSKASWLGYGGSRGGAKSGAIRRIMVRRRLDYPGTAGQIIRRVWDDVQKNHINKMWDDFPELRQYYRAGERTILMPNGSRIFFDAAENAPDVERKGYGPEYMDISIDQAEQFSEKELKQLKTTCRWPGMPEHRCKFGLFFNPGGQGAGFLQRIFVTHDLHEREVPEDFCFLQAYVWDNVEWSRDALRLDILGAEKYSQWNEFPNFYREQIDDQVNELFYSWNGDRRYEYTITRSQYGQELNRLDATMRPGQLLGDFTRFAGQYFSNFNEARHKVSLAGVLLQPWWPRWVSIDWGYQHHSAIYWHIQVGTVDETGGKTRPLTVTYREWVVNHLSERALAEEIVRRNGTDLAREEKGDKIANIYAGHDLWKKDDSGKTKEAIMSEVFLSNGLPSIKRAAIDRVNGWRLMHMMLDEGEWLISDDCPKAISAIPTGIYDEKADKEDILDSKDEQADIRDSLRYGIYTQFAPSFLPFEEKLKQATNHLTDPTERAIRMQKLTAEHDLAKRNYGMANLRVNARERFRR